MLLTFKTANFLSFNEEIAFSMLAGQPRQLPSHVITCGEGRNRVEVLKTAVIYGANASGKSNLVKAMDFARKIIVNGVKTETTANKYFRLDPANREKPSKFEFEFKINEKMYAYGFTLHLESKKFQSEWLVELGKTTDKPIFERNVLANGKSECKLYLKLTGKIKTRFEVYQEDLLDTQLFLRELQEKNLEEVKEVESFFSVFDWLFLGLFIVFPEHIMDLRLLSHFDQNGKETFIKILKKFKTGIYGIDMKESNFTSDLAEKITNKELLGSVLSSVSQGGETNLSFNNGKNSYYLYKDGNTIKARRTVVLQSEKAIEFEIDELSDGTRRLLDLVPLLSK